MAMYQCAAPIDYRTLAAELEHQGTYELAGGLALSGGTYIYLSGVADAASARYGAGDEGGGLLCWAA